MSIAFLVEPTIVLLLTGALAGLVAPKSRRGVLLCGLLSGVAVGPLAALLQRLGVALPLADIGVGSTIEDTPSQWIAIYGSVACILAVRLMYQLWTLEQIHRRARSLTPAEHGSLPGPLRHLASRIAVSEEAGAGCVLGLWRPRILLPEGFAAWPDARLSMILQHEANHLRNHDGRWLAFAELLLAAFWFHPAVHWIINQLRSAMEDACDAAVVQAGVEPRRYAECLLDSASGRASVPPLAPAMAKPGSQLKRRLLLILHPQAQRMGLSPRYLQLALLLAGILLAACGPSAKTDRALTDEAELRLEAAPFPQP